MLLSISLVKGAGVLDISYRIFMFLINPRSGNVGIQKLIAKHIFEYFEKRKGEDGKSKCSRT